MLGGNDLFTSENLETWIMTGNNLRLTGSEGLAERSAFIHLHTMRENAEDYFAESDSVLPTIMVTKHREQVLEAIYAIVDYWVSLGCPKYQGNVSARLQSWLQVMGGLLESCGVHGVILKPRWFLQCWGRVLC